jgi:exodeoxyribonuclease VII small subunit
VAKAKKSIDFEQALDQLEELVEDMENGDLTLEESLKAFEEGIKLTRECQTALSEAEQKVQMLIEENGELKSVTVSFDEDETD